MDGEKVSDVDKDQMHCVQEVTFMELTLMIKEEEFSSSEDDINNLQREKEREMDGEKASDVDKDQICSVQEVTCMELTPIIKEEAFSGSEGDIDNLQRQKEREMDGEQASDLDKDQIHHVQELACMEITPMIKEEELSDHHERNESPEFCRKQVSPPALSVNYIGYMEGENPVVLYIKEGELSSEEAEIGKDDGDQVSLQSEHVNQSSCSDGKDCINISLCHEIVQTDTSLSSVTPASTDYAVFMKSTGNSESNLSCCTNEDAQPRSGEEMTPSAEVTKQENSDPVKALLFADIGNWRSKPLPHKQHIYDEESMVKNSESCDCKMHESTGSICSFCHKKFERTDETGGTKQHQCLVCSCSFAKERQRTKHLRSRKQTYKDEPQEIQGRCITDKTGESRGDSHEGGKESCDFTESARSSNESHHTIDIGGEKHLQCMFCTCSFPAECQLPEHSRSHSSREPMRNFQCLYCKKLFVSNHKLMKHMKRCTGKRPKKTYECSCCGSMFKKKVDFKMHIMKRCTGQRPKKMLKKIYECACCGSMFKKKVDFKMHIMKRCTGKRPKKMLKKIYECSCCGSMFKKKVDFKMHIMKRCTGGRPKKMLKKIYECACCGSMFKKKVDFKMHIMKRCTGKRPKKMLKKIYECSCCNIMFQRKIDFKMHIMKRCGKRLKKTYQCSCCNSMFEKKIDFKMHIRKGCTGKKLKKTYECSCCSSMFEKKSDFKTHVRREHVKEKCKLIWQGSACTLEKKFQCCCCGKEFQEKSDLTRHVRGEKKCKKIDRGEMRHECPYCGMKFSCIRHLNEHFQSHAETQTRKREENFPCCFCSMQFRKVSILAQHIKSHSAEQSNLDLAMIRYTRKNLPEHSLCKEKFTTMKKKEKHIVKEYSMLF